MLICTHCGYTADETSANWDQQDIHTPIEEGECTCCPECGEFTITIAKKCAHCEEWCDPATLVLVSVEDKSADDFDNSSTEIEVCPDCYEEHYFREEDYM